MVDLLPLGALGALRGPRPPPPGPAGPGAGPSVVDAVDGQLGLLKSRLFSALESLEGSQILSNLSSRLETALSLSQESEATPSAASPQSPDEASRGLREGSDAKLPSGASNDAASKDSRPSLPEACGPDPYEKLHYKIEAASSSSGSEGDGYGPSTSIDSPDHDAKYWIRSGSEGSVRSWASSLSLDSQSDEATAAAVEFMRKYVSDLFGAPGDISLEQKAKFGQLAQTEAGRLWFSRFVNAQRVHNLRVNESTFYSLVQHFAIVLFECADADDFGPSKSLMNMCFTFYHEVDVPGCEPYKEYLSVYLREQPIWHSLRFWNAALFDALQCERQHAGVPALAALDAEQEYQENVTFGKLGTFTCNMHAFGLSRELCTEFLRKQCVIANLREDQEKMLRDNVERMYSETERWRSP